MANPIWDAIYTAIARIKDAQPAITEGRIEEAQAALAEALKLLDKVTASDPGDGTGVRS